MLRIPIPSNDCAARGSRPITLEELDEANTFALVTFADPDPEFPPRREAARERMPKRMAERQRKAEMHSHRR